jgi:hypothetical protein
MKWNLQAFALIAADSGPISRELRTISSSPWFRFGRPKLGLRTSSCVSMTTTVTTLWEGSFKSDTSANCHFASQKWEPTCDLDQKKFSRSLFIARPGWAFAFWEYRHDHLDDSHDCGRVACRWNFTGGGSVGHDQASSSSGHARSSGHLQHGPRRDWCLPGEWRPVLQ